MRVAAVTDVELFGQDARYSVVDGQAARIFQAWRATIYCKPIQPGDRMRKLVEARIVEALEMGYTYQVIGRALESAWNFRKPKPDGTSAWQVALAKELRAEAKLVPKLTETQLAIQRVRQHDTENNGVT
jgi:hypothetical protein